MKDRVKNLPSPRVGIVSVQVEVISFFVEILFWDSEEVNKK